MRAQRSIWDRSRSRASGRGRSTVEWGDGQSSTFSPSGSGPLAFAHTYESPRVVHDLRDRLRNMTATRPRITFPDPVDVVNEPVVVTGVPVAATLDASTGNVLVATFTDPEGPSPVGDYSASIAWGDGSSPSSGTISYNSATEVFSVYGSHTYTAVGTDTITVSVSHQPRPRAWGRPRRRSRPRSPRRRSAHRPRARSTAQP